MDNPENRNHCYAYRYESFIFIHVKGSNYENTKGHLYEHALSKLRTYEGNGVKKAKNNNDMKW